MKIVTMYLPQFYETEENNRWWGKGFTEWTAVKGAKAFFEGHNQPRKPLNDRYYNLLDKETMIWQSDLMEEYHIYGQCFYHYWFENGKQILEKPAENLLKWSDIPMPFCFCWANESWVRSWSAIVDSNTWALKFEPIKGNTEDTGILLHQGYGTEYEWKQHFEYLLPFFKDKRYIKIHEKPIFIFYRPDNIQCLREMTNCWNRWAREKGLKGIYFIGGNTSDKRCLDATYLHATGSMFPTNYYKVKDSVKTISYDAVWKYIISQGIMAEKEMYIGGIIDFDTSPRKGKNGVVITECDSVKYEKYLKKLLKLNADLGNEITFINAWNEWGEGMYLEPDKKNSFEFLEATKRALEFYTNENIDHDIENDKKNLLIFYKNKMEQYKKNWSVLEQWMQRKEHKAPLSKTLEKMKITSVAIYGLGMFGRHLKAELEDSDIIIKYAIDIRKQGIVQELPVLDLNDDFPEVDAIIVTVVNEFDTIVEQLREKTNIPVISLEKILFEQECTEL